MSPIFSHMEDYAGRIITFGEVADVLSKRLARRSYSRVLDELTKGALEIRNEIVLSMRNSPATGRRYRVGKNKRGKGVYHRASSPGFPPRPRSGDLINSILMQVGHTQVEVGSIITRPAYPKFLEYGTAKMAARPWLEPAVKQQKPFIQAAVKRVLAEVAREMKE